MTAAILKLAALWQGSASVPYAAAAIGEGVVACLLLADRTACLAASLGAATLLGAAGARLFTQHGRALAEPCGCLGSVPLTDGAAVILAGALIAAQSAIVVLRTGPSDAP